MYKYINLQEGVNVVIGGLVASLCTGLPSLAATSRHNLNQGLLGGRRVHWALAEALHEARKDI